MPRSGYRRAFTTPETDVPLRPDSVFHFPESMFHLLRIAVFHFVRIRCSTSSGVRTSSASPSTRRCLPRGRSRFCAAARRGSHGLLHGHCTEEDALLTVRGRIRLGDQIRRRFGIPLPVEVRYDEFTHDILLTLSGRVKSSHS